jgi:hypothetical protein
MEFLDSTQYSGSAQYIIQGYPKIYTCNTPYKCYLQNMEFYIVCAVFAKKIILLKRIEANLNLIRLIFACFVFSLILVIRFICFNSLQIICLMPFLIFALKWISKWFASLRFHFKAKLQIICFCSRILFPGMKKFAEIDFCLKERPKRNGQMVHCFLPNWLLPTAHFLLFNAYCPLFTAFCLLFTAHCLLIAVHCSLVTTSYPQFIAKCHC